MSDLKPAKPEGKTLTAAQQSFVEAYVTTGKISRAARACKISEDYAWQMTRLPKFRHVQAAIQAAFADYKSIISSRRHILVNWAFNVVEFQMSSVSDEDGNLLPWSEIDPEDEQCLAELTVKEYDGGRTLRAKPVNKAVCAQLLGKWGGMVGAAEEDTSRATAEEVDRDLRDKIGRLAARMFPSPGGESAAAVVSELASG